ERAVGMLSSAVREPTFPPEEFEKLRKRVRAGLAIEAVEPATKASREMRRRLFGSHPYARTATGETEDIDALNVADCQKWWNSFSRPEDSVLIFAGDVTSEEALA